MQIDQFRIDRNAPPFRSEARKFRGFDMDGQLADDTLCYAIRSYVVARDSKGSDSTHPVGYSTCQKASRYRLRTAGGPSASVDR